MKPQHACKWMSMCLSICRILSVGLVSVGEKVSRLDVSNRGGMKTSASCVAISPGEEGVTNGYP